MKKNIIIMLAVTAVIWCGCVFQRIQLENAAEFAVNALSETEKALSDDGFRSAEVEYIKYRIEWKKHEKALSLSVSHDELDNIAMQNARLGACINTGNSLEAAAVFSELREAYIALESGFRVNPQNIL